MCDICKTEPGDIMRMGQHEVELICNNHVIGKEDLSVYYYVDDEETPSNYIVADYWVNNTYNKAVVRIPIKFCPFCGRKLHND